MKQHNLSLTHDQTIQSLHERIFLLESEIKRLQNESKNNTSKNDIALLKMENYNLRNELLRLVQ